MEWTVVVKSYGVLVTFCIYFKMTLFIDKSLYNHMSSINFEKQTLTCPLCTPLCSPPWADWVMTQKGCV